MSMSYNGIHLRGQGITKGALLHLIISFVYKTIYCNTPVSFQRNRIQIVHLDWICANNLIILKGIQDDNSDLRPKYRYLCYLYVHMSGSLSEWPLRLPTSLTAMRGFMAIILGVDIVDISTHLWNYLSPIQQPWPSHKNLYATGKYLSWPKCFILSPFSLAYH